MKSEFDANESRRRDLVERGSNAILGKLDGKEKIRLLDEAGRELMAELNPDGTKNITLNENQISKKAVEIYNRENVSTEPESVSTEPKMKHKPQQKNSQIKHNHKPRNKRKSAK